MIKTTIFYFVCEFSRLVLTSALTQWSVSKSSVNYMKSLCSLRVTVAMLMSFWITLIRRNNISVTDCLGNNVC